MNIMSLKKKSRAGFTLVELIVVIAILAILAGVAIPVYSGYIKKANEAADLQLLGAVNTAFAAACLENNVASSKIPDGAATLTLTGKCITGVSVTDAGITAASIKAAHNDGGFAMLGAHTAQLTATSAQITASFAKYFSGNETRELKFYTSASDFEFKDGAFHGKGEAGAGSTPKTSTWTPEGSDQSFTMTFSDADVNAVNNSSFVDEDLGVDVLLNEVNAVTTLATNALNSTGGGKGQQLINGIVSSPEFLAFAAEKLGGALSAEQLAGALNGTLDPSTLNEEQAAVLQRLMTNENTISNALVLYAAQQSGGLANDAAFRTELAAMDINGTVPDGSGSFNDDMITLGLAAYNAIYGAGGSQDNAGAALAKAAYGYGMSIAYGNYKAKEGNSEVTWAQYLESDQGKADFAAYASCMNMINSNATDANITSALLESGFGDDNLAAALIAALGGGN